MPNSFFDCPLAPLLTAPELGHTALPFMHVGISLHYQLVLATQGTIRIISSIPVRLLVV